MSRPALHEIPARSASGAFRVVIEAPRGAAVKTKFDPALGVFTLSRPLPLGLAYPFDWGFVPGTRAADGDPLDAMVLLDAGTWPGVVVPCRAIGVVKLEQDGEDGVRERNDRVIAVPEAAPRLEDVRDCADLAPRVREEIEQFFLSAAYFEPRNAKLLGWGDARAAERMVDRAAAAARAKGKKSRSASRG